MFLTVIFALFLAKMKKYDLKCILKAYPLYPIFIFEVFNFYLQMNIFASNYVFAPYVSFLKSAYMFLYIIPVIAYQLYKPAFIGSLFIFLGTFMNKVVIAFNGGKMPVFPSFSKFTGYYSPEMFDLPNSIHILGSSQTKLKFLSDFIDIGYSVLSIGDIIIRIFVVLIIFNSIKHLNATKKQSR